MRLGRLIFFEYRKMIKRKSFWISILAAFGLIFYMNSMMDSREIYVEGTYVTNGREYIKMEREEGKKLKGTVLSEEKLAEIESMLSEKERVDFTAENYMDMRKKYMPAILLSNYLEWKEEHPGKDLAGAWKEMLTEKWENEKLTQPETDYLKAKSEQVEMPLRYAYNKAYDRMTSLQISNMLFLSLTIVICLAPLFAEEYSTKTDALILTSKKGHGITVAAKIITGLSFSLLISGIGFLMALLQQIFIYGSGSLDTPMQILWQMSTSAFPFSVGTLTGMTVGFGILSSLMVGIVTMLFSARMKSAFGPVVLGILFSFLPLFNGLFANMSPIIRKIIDSLPGNFATSTSFLSDEMLVLGSQVFPAYVYVTAVYGGLAILFLLLTGRGYLRRQPG